MKNLLSVAIDGPAAAGKSTIAKIISKKLNYIYIDTGAMYRSHACFALRRGCSLQDEQLLLDLLMSIEIEFQNGAYEQEIFVNGENVTEAIRTPEVTKAVPCVSKYPLIREEMVRRQKQFAEQGGVVMDGRDIGTAVMPDAEVKIFMTASVEQRAIRRYSEMLAKGYDSNLEQLKAEIVARDKADLERIVSPLRKADDAVELDTSNKSIEEIVKQILDIVRARKLNCE